MSYFNTRELAGMAVFAGLWGILNVMISPIFYQIFHLPFFCDVIGFSILILTVWSVRKLGSATFVGFLALIINLLLRPTAIHFLGFFAASISLDAILFLTRYRIFNSGIVASVGLLATSIFSAAIAGSVIGLFFMSPAVLVNWGGTLSWAGLHAIGGAIGGAIGVFLVNALSARGIIPRAMEAN